MASLFSDRKKKRGEWAGTSGPPVTEREKLKCTENNVERGRGDPLEGGCEEEEEEEGGGRGRKGLNIFEKIKDGGRGEEEGLVPLLTTTKM